MTLPSLFASLFAPSTMQLRLTRFGIGFLGLMLVSLLGFTNYAISLGYAFSFVLGGIWIVTAAQVVGASKRLGLQFEGPPEGVAGQATRFGYQVSNQGFALTLNLRARVHRLGSEQRHPIQLRSYVGAKRQVLLYWPLLLERGVWQMDQVLVERTDFLGLWKVSMPLPAPPEITIYPQAEANAPAPSSAQGGGEQQNGPRTAGQDELSGLRPYQAGDTPRQISWKHVARRGELITREFDAPQVSTLDLTWDMTLAVGDHEARIARLAAWVHMARAKAISFSLTLSTGSTGRGTGELHARKALLLLALLPPHTDQANAQAPTVYMPPEPDHLPTTPMQSTILALAFAFLPLLWRQPFWMTLITGGALSYQYLSADPKRKLPRLSLSMLLLATVLVGFLLSRAYDTLLSQEAGTSLLALLIVFKLAESKNVRDAKVVILLGLFFVGTHFFMDQGLLSLLHVLLTIMLLLAVGARWATPPQGLWQVSLWPIASLRRAAHTMLLALPFAVLLFLAYPRPAGPLWSLPSQQSQTGLGDEINAGSVSNLAKSTTVAFRVDFQSTPPANAELYWRGPVYERFDGVKWTQLRGRQFLPPSAQIGDQSWRYTLTLEPNGKPWLLALDLATELPQRSFLTTAFQAMTFPPANARTSYDMVSTQAKLGIREDEERLTFNRILPPLASSNPRALALAQSWQSLPPQKRVEAALALFGNGEYSYTLEPPLLPEQGRIDAFLYDAKRGFCEHYASAFAFLMRAAGVPARLVAGYQGAEPNLDADYFIVRQQNAHAWTEVWLQGEGWVRVDPTAVVAPARIQLGLETALNDPNGTAAKPPNAWKKLTLRLDALQSKWNGLLTQFDGSGQRAFWAAVRRTLQSLPVWAYLLLPVLIAAGLWGRQAWQASQRRPKDPSQLALHELEQRLQLPMQTGEPLSQYAERASALYPEQAQALRALTQTYNRLRYGEPEQHSTLATQLLQQVRSLPQQRKKT